MKSRDIVLLVGLGWLSIGALALGASLFVGLQRAFAPFADDPFPLDIPFFQFFFLHMRELIGVQAVVGALSVFGAIAFLRRRPWARYACQAFACLGVVWDLVFGVSWLQSVNLLTTAETDAPFFRVAGIGVMMFGLAVIIVQCGVWVFCIWLLNRPRIWAEFASAR